MVDVGPKPWTQRSAEAQAQVRMQPATADALRAATLPKGDALVAAQIAGILAAKQTGALIPLAHTLPLSAVDVRFDWVEPALLRIIARAATTGPTGVEMEALTAVSVACLTIYDMIKAVERGVRIEGIHLIEKTGGKSGRYRASE